MLKKWKQDSADMTKKNTDKKGKPPSFPLYVRDVLSDTELQMSDEITRGIWLNFLCHMWGAKERGKLEGTVEQMAKLGNTTIEKFVVFMSDAVEFEFCDFEFVDSAFEEKFINSAGRFAGFCKDVTKMSHLMSQEIIVINRRMYRVEKKRKSDRERKRRSREFKKSRSMSRKCHSDVTAEKGTPSSSSSSSVLDLSKDKSEIGPHKVADDKPPPEAADADAIPFNIPGKKESSSRHFSVKVGEHFKSIKSSCDAIRKLPQKNGHKFNPYQFVQKHVNDKRHPGAIADTITAMSDPDVFSGIRGDPFAYGNSILKTKNQNWNEKEAILIHEELKKITIPELEQLTHGMLKEIG